MKILKIEIRHAIPVNIPVQSPEEIERFRRKLVRQCRIEPEDKVDVYFITQDDGPAH